MTDEPADRDTNLGLGGRPPATVRSIGQDDQPSLVVVRAVAAHKDVPPTGLEPLCHAVDPGTLDRLTNHTGRDGRPDEPAVCFRYEASIIDVTPEEVRVREPEADS